MIPDRPPFSFKIADQPEEFEQISALNYRCFVEEIPQHPPNPERRLVDRFHRQNTYLLVMDGDTLAGMVAVRDQRPFSLDEKLPDLEALMPPERPVCELRLFAVAPGYRDAIAMLGLRDMTLAYLAQQGLRLAVLSGTTRQLRLYRHLGFEPFGPQVGSEEARFQPFFLRLSPP